MLYEVITVDHAVPENIMTLLRQPSTTAGWLSLLAVGSALWLALYQNLSPLAESLIGGFGLDRRTHFGEALHFFFYDTPKVLLLLTGIVFV